MTFAGTAARGAGDAAHWASYTVTTRLAFWIAREYPFGYNVAHEYL